MRIVLRLVRKEVLLLLRDWHALLLLFLMPAAFILIMSLALQNQFSAAGGAKLSYALVGGTAPALQKLDGFRQVDGSATESELRTRLRAGKLQFLVIVPADYATSLARGKPQPVKLIAAPDVPAAAYKLFESGARAALMKSWLRQRLHARGIPVAALDDGSAQHLLAAAEPPPGAPTAEAMPSSVQQNVPAWLLFAMFFIAIPLSTTWLAERDQGTYLRLRSMGLTPPLLMAGKVIPYIGLNLLQVVLMLLVGVFVVPQLGGDALTLGHAPLALALVAAAASFAAVAYALLVANLVSTSEQATIFTGVANLLMAALGGIMVPRFVMPQALQAISHYSPMAWGLDGFLDVLLRDGGIGMIAAPALKLCGFGCACLAVAGLFMVWRRGR
jgi:ABC-2 type transport system permease protein